MDKLWWSVLDGGSPHYAAGYATWLKNDDDVRMVIDHGTFITSVLSLLGLFIYGRLELLHVPSDLFVPYHEVLIFDYYPPCIYTASSSAFEGRYHHYEANLWIKISQWLVHVFRRR